MQTLRGLLDRPKDELNDSIAVPAASIREELECSYHVTSFIYPEFKGSKAKMKGPRTILSVAFKSPWVVSLQYVRLVR